MQILFFGTFDEQAHPRVRVLREGLIELGQAVTVCNAPLGLTTEARVRLARQPWRLPVLVARLAVCWARLICQSRGLRPDVVVVGYLGQFDVHLARWRFRRATLVLDHMVGLGDTVRDRGLDGRSRIGRLLDAVDRSAIRAADVVVIDTDEQQSLVPKAQRERLVTVPVGAPHTWTAARHGHLPAPDLRLVFFGLYTPLQGAAVIGQALRALPDVPLRCTMVGRGQDLPATRAAVGDDPRVTWIDWLDEAALAALVATNDVCLGIFGDTEKALRVVPNKVYQGAAAGCAIVTSDTPPQRRTLGDDALFVPPGDPQALAAALRTLARDPGEVARLRIAAATRSDRCFTPAAVVAPLLSRLEVNV